jgi:hypothetical protein
MHHPWDKRVKQMPHPWADKSVKINFININIFVNEVICCEL